MDGHADGFGWLLAEHPAVVLSIVGFVLVTVTLPLLSIFLKLGTLIRRLDEHTERIERLEERKIDTDTCAAFHRGLNENLQQLFREHENMRQAMLDMASGGNKKSY